MIVVATAQDNIASSTKWVAQSLALVCREFRRTVEPILVDTVRITNRNSAEIIRQRHRFVRARRILPYSSGVRGKVVLLCVEQLASQPAFRPVAATVHVKGHSNDPSLCIRIVSVASVTHLHIRLYPAAFNEQLSAFIPLSVTHLVLDPLIRNPDTSPLVVAGLAAFLRERPPSVLRRLLVRTLCIFNLADIGFVDALADVAVFSGDARLWLDDAVPYAGFDADAEQIAADEDQDIALWYTGRQLA